MLCKKFENRKCSYYKQSKYFEICVITVNENEGCECRISLNTNLFLILQCLLHRKPSNINGISIILETASKVNDQNIFFQEGKSVNKFEWNNIFIFPPDYTYNTDNIALHKSKILIMKNSKSDQDYIITNFIPYYGYLVTLDDHIEPCIHNIVIEL